MLIEWRSSEIRQQATQCGRDSGYLFPAAFAGLGWFFGAVAGFLLVHYPGVMQLLPVSGGLSIMTNIPPEPPGPKGFPTRAFLIGAGVMAVLWIVGLMLFG